MARLWARTTSFESVEVGDELPILVKWETSETIDRFTALVGVGEKAVAADGDQPAEDHGMAGSVPGPGFLRHGVAGEGISLVKNYCGRQ